MRSLEIDRAEPSDILSPFQLVVGLACVGILLLYPAGCRKELQPADSGTGATTDIDEADDDAAREDVDAPADARPDRHPPEQRDATRDVDVVDTPAEDVRDGGRPETRDAGDTYQGPTGGVGIEPRLDYGNLEAHWVSPSGSSGAAGSESDPWNVAGAEANAEPGDVVHFLPGTYNSEIQPPSGTENAPVVFRSATRHEAVIEGDGEFTLDGTEHVHIQGFRFRAGDWVTVLSASDIVLRDNFMLGGVDDNTRLVAKEGTRDVKIYNNVFRDGGGHNMFFLRDIQAVVIAGNAFARAGHTPAQLLYDFGDVVLRGNVFHNAIGRNMAINGDAEHILFEHNLMANAWDGPNSASTQSKWVGQESIFRFNRVVDNHGIALVSNLFADWQGDIGPTRIYHNVLVANSDKVWRFWDRGSEYPLEDHELENNIFADNNGGGPQIQVAFQAEANDLLVRNNFFPGGDVVQHGRTLGAEAVPLEEAASSWGDIYVDNSSGDPGFADPANFDYRLDADSPARSAGAPLTRTTASGDGRTVPVEDARYFFDGYGIPGERGDRIRIGSTTVTVESVDRANDRIEIDRSLEWDSGASVGLPWTGETPDAGRFPAGRDSAHPAVLAPRTASIGEEISFDLDRGGSGRVAEICWQFGDGTGSCGRRVTHTYHEPYDYPVRVRLVTSDGRVHWGTHYVYVSDDQTDPASTDYNRSEVEKFTGSSG